MARMPAERTPAEHGSPEYEPQSVVVPPSAAAVILVLTVKDGAEASVRSALADLLGIARAVAFRSPAEDVTAAIGIGADLWDRMYNIDRPAGLHRFEPITGDTHTAPSTPGDLLFHVRGPRFDLCFEVAHQMTRRLGTDVEVVDETHGFKYFDERDMLGFVDGTESPTGLAAARTVFTDDSDPQFAGSSYLIVQKYLHDLDAWNQLTVEQQEQAIGRHKLSDIEFPDDQKAPNSHVALNTITDDEGNDLEIVRENMPFGSVGAGQFGTYFIGYARDPAITERMLRNMFIGDPPGNHDRVLDFSNAVTGTLFFIPTVDFLEDPTVN